MKLAINQYICPINFPIEVFFKYVKESGAEAVGLSSHIIQSYSLNEINYFLKKYKLKVSSLNSAGYFLYNSIKEKSNQNKKNKELIEFASAIEAKTLCIITGGISHGEWTIGEARYEVLSQLSELADKSKSYGVKLGLEPIHPIDLHQKGIINNISSAIKVINKIPDLNIIIDFFHSWWDPDLISFIDRYTDKLILIQFCNTLEQNINHKPFRELPLNGSIDIRMLINKAKMSGYNGYFEFELFNKDLRGRSVKSIIKKASEQFFRIINYE